MKAAAFVFLVFVICAGDAEAQGYIGYQAGKSWQYGLGDNPKYLPDCQYLNEQQATSDSFFAGYRLKRIGLEIGYGSLFHSRFVAECPSGVGNQFVDGKYTYAMASYYYPITGSVDVFAGIGIARIHSINFETAHYGLPSEPLPLVTNFEDMKETRPILSLGLQKNLGRWFVRLNGQIVKNIAQSHWTLSNDVRTLQLGVGWRLW